MPAFVSKGYLGVELFFVLSGFILCHVYLQKFGERRFSYRDSSGSDWHGSIRSPGDHRRPRRDGGGRDPRRGERRRETGGLVILPGQLTLTQAWGLAPLGGWNHPSWSISAEWFAYLGFPVFAWAAWRLRSRPGLAVALALGLVVSLYPAFERLAGMPLTAATTAWASCGSCPVSPWVRVYLLWKAIP